MLAGIFGEHWGHFLTKQRFIIIHGNVTQWDDASKRSVIERMNHSASAEHMASSYKSVSKYFGILKFLHVKY